MQKNKQAIIIDSYFIFLVSEIPIGRIAPTCRRSPRRRSRTSPPAAATSTRSSSRTTSIDSINSEGFTPSQVSNYEFQLFVASCKMIEYIYLKETDPEKRLNYRAFFINALNAINNG